jgi:catechol 2,3-dioxygenase-like lactoylglutathione lyase family enzyme
MDAASTDSGAEPNTSAQPAGDIDVVPTVREMRLVVTADDHAAAVHFYRDVLGMAERASYSSPDGQVVILEGGRATLEIADRAQAEFIDRVEVGRRVAGHIRVAFEVKDSAATAQTLVDAGAELVAGATRTPWDTVNVRLNGPADLQLTLFSEAPPQPET